MATWYFCCCDQGQTGPPGGVIVHHGAVVRRYDDQGSIEWEYLHTSAITSIAVAASVGLVVGFVNPFTLLKINLVNGTFVDEIPVTTLGTNIVAGLDRFTTFGTSNNRLAVVDYDGNELYRHQLGFQWPGGNFDASNNLYVIAGTFDVEGVKKFDASGTEVWSALSRADFPVDLALSKQGDVFALTKDASDSTLHKLDTDGNVAGSPWPITIAGLTGQFVDCDADGNVYVKLGATVHKYNTAGTQIYSRSSGIHATPEIAPDDFGRCWTFGDPGVGNTQIWLISADGASVAAGFDYFSVPTSIEDPFGTVVPFR